MGYYLKFMWYVKCTVCELVDTTCFASFWGPNNCRGPMSCDFFPRHFTDEAGLLYFSAFFTLQMTWEFAVFFLGGMSDNSHVICRFYNSQNESTDESEMDNNKNNDSDNNGNNNSNNNNSNNNNSNNDSQGQNINNKQQTIHTHNNTQKYPTNTHTNKQTKEPTHNSQQIANDKCIQMRSSNFTPPTTAATTTITTTAGRRRRRKKRRRRRNKKKVHRSHAHHTLKVPQQQVDNKDSHQSYCTEMPQVLPLKMQ